MVFPNWDNPKLFALLFGCNAEKNLCASIKKRVKRLLEALFCFVDGEFDDYGFDIKHNNWIEEDTQNPKLIVQTTLVTLELLTQKDKYDGKLTKSQIREALKLLDKDNDDSLLKILEDNRATKRGSDNWHFTLKLWSKDKEQNLKRFDEVWESNRPSKSKALEANYQRDDGVTTVTRPKIGIFQAPPLPTYYVDRPEYSQDLKNRLLTDSSDIRTLVVTAIHGLGSVGKSTITTALAHDQEVQTHFYDGILWATLGQQPNLLSLLSGWVQALGDYNFKATSVEATSNHLRTLLYDKAVLLVVDDAWNTQDAQAFNVGGARCQVLVTTREAGIAQVLGGSTYSLNVMTPSQSMELLTKKIGRKFTDTETQEASALAQALGYLPLALELAAAQVAGGTPWAVIVQDIQQEVARLKTLDNESARDANDEASLKRLSLTSSLNLSVQRLSDETRENFIWLGILPEDVTITQAMTATLWDMDAERDAGDELCYLHSKALLLSGVPLLDGTPTYRLHDLFHDLARNLLTTSPNPKRKGNLPGLGITMPAAHATFLEKYRNLTDNNLWHTLPSDGYIHQHLVWHLEKAQKVEEIHLLLREESATGGNGWYEACDSLGQTANFVTNVARAWQLAEDSWNDINLPQVVGLQCRYALIIASLNSLAANLPVELLIALIKKNVWAPEQGLGYALQSSNPEQKSRLLTELANHLPQKLKEVTLSKALFFVKEIRNEGERAYALSNLASKLPKLLPEALVAARKIQHGSYRADALNNLASKLPKLLPEALVAAKKIQNESFRAAALTNIADKLPSELLPEVLAAVRKIHDEYSRAAALSCLADKVPSELLPEVLAAAREIRNEEERVYALSCLADKVPSELLPEVLAAAREIQHESYHTTALGCLADKIPSELLPEVLAAAREIQHEPYRANVLSRLANKLPELLPEALAAAREIQDEYNRANVISRLANKLPELLPEALAAARKIRNESFRVTTLSHLAVKLPPELLPEALAAAREIRDEYNRANVLSHLADRLPELFPEALAAAREIRDEYNRANVLSHLADRLPELFPEALAAARDGRDEKSRTNALNSLIDKLPSELLPEALAAARKIRNEKSRTNALSRLANKLPEFLPEALAAAREIQDEYNRAYALSNLVDKIPELLPEALAAAREIQDEYNRAYALNSLVDKIPELLPEALAAAREIQDEYNRAYALNSLVDKLPELFLEALTVAKKIPDENNRTKTLIRWVNKLPPELLPEALAAARKIQNESNRAYALNSLADKLPELLPEALAAAREIRDEYHRAYALNSLVDKLPELLPEILATVGDIRYEAQRADALNKLAKKLLNIQKNQLFSLWQEILYILSLRTRPNLLSDIKALTPVIHTLGREQALKNIAYAILDVSRWWQ